MLKERIPNINDVDLSWLESVTYGAAPITEEVLVNSMNTFKAQFYQVYGLTETSGGVTMLHPDEHDPGGPRADFLRSCGRVVEGSELRIVNRENGEDMADGEVGDVDVGARIGGTATTASSTAPAAFAIAFSFPFFPST